jgi:CRISPR/Cas system-associated endoribonuclease Cas2
LGFQNSIFAGESRSEAIEDIERDLPYLEDTDMLELSVRVIGEVEASHSGKYFPDYFR